MFAGVSGGALVCAGGANFPEKPLAEGGRKVWHDRIFALSHPDGSWREIGRLAGACGYGVSATWRDSVVLAGGCDAQAHSAACLTMQWDGTHLAFRPLPSLPCPIANACGALVDDTLIVAGGQETPTSTTALARCFALNLGAPEPAWKEIPWPAAAPARIFAVAAAEAGAFYLFSGAELIPQARGGAERRYLNDAWSFHPDRGWRRLADLPHAVVAAPSPAMATTAGTFLIAGGVWPEYLSALPKDAPHPGFSRDLLRYDVAADRWTELSAPMVTNAAPARVTAPLAAWQDHFVIPSGEVAPGIRTPSVLTYPRAP